MNAKRKRCTAHTSDPSEIESASSSSDDDFASRKANCKPTSSPTKPIVHEQPNRQDLAVNKSKVDAVDAWLRTNDQSGRLMLLSGPSGAGKTATLLTLAAEHDVQIIEWINPVDQNKDFNGQSYDFNYTSQAARFEDFLLSSGRYSSVIGPAIAKKLILVQEYPNSFNINPEIFHRIIQRYVKLGRSPIVFIISDTHHSMFTPCFIADVHIEQITFNAVTRTALSKAIDRIAQLEGREDVSFEVRNAVCDAAHGDMRNAVIAWQYHTRGLSAGPRPVLRRQPKRRNTKKQEKENKNALVLDGKDELSEFLPTVGRVLYAKRGPAVAGSCPDADSRGSLKTDPQQVVDKFSSEANKFLTLAHENYLTIFSDIHSAVLAADWLSTADIILGEWRNDNSCRELGFSVGVRGLMNACNKPIMRWASLRKSRWFQTSQKAEEHVRRVKSVYALNCSSTQALLLDIIPMTPTLRTNPYAGIVSASARDLSHPASPEPTIEDDSDSS